LTCERDGSAALHEQLESRLREMVRSGQLAPGTRLPSSRSLAAELGVSRGVVLEAYSQLTAEGYLTASQGAPTRVATMSTAERPPLPAGTLEGSYRFDLRPGIPDLMGFPREGWTRMLRLALRAASFEALGYGDPRGTPELRNQLMRYLGRARGAAPEPEHTIVCTGFTEGLALVCRALRDRGVERIAIEDPGYAHHRLIAERAGVEPVPVRVDELGLDVEELRKSDCEVLVVTPAHQFPTGVVLGAERRAALLDWAEEVDGLIIEDDYDSELRYDRVAVGALQGLSPERVCHIGSTSKRLAPGIRLGWIISPSWLTGALTYEKALASGPSAVLEQLALAELIARGELDRHLRRMRLRYRARRGALIAALGRWLPDAQTIGIPAGLHVLVQLSGEVDEDAMLSAMAAQGVGAEGLAWHRLGRAEGPGLVLGFGQLEATAFEQAAEVMAEAASAAV
jgi:GntR family transcriptional regulator/MocR family aminotransferase